MMVTRSPLRRAGRATIVAPLGIDPRGQRYVERAADAVLRQELGQRGPRRDLGRHRERVLEPAGFGEAARGEAGGDRFGAVEDAAGEDHVHRDVGADRAGQQLGAAGARDQSQGRLRQADAGAGFGG